MIITAKSLWPEDEKFALERKKTGNEYIFIHTITEMRAFAGGEIKLLPADSVICYAPETYQYIEAVQGGLIHDWMHLSPRFSEIAEKYSFETEKIYPLPDGGFVTKLMQEAELEMLSADEFSDDICEIKVREMIARIVRAQKSSYNKETVSPAVYEAFTDARAKIHMEYFKPWNIESMAELVHLSPSRFFSLYKRVFGISPKSDLLSVRMEHAKLILFDGKISVKETAEMTGYTNVYHFIRAFKQHTGKTPGQFRKTEYV